MSSPSIRNTTTDTSRGAVRFSVVLAATFKTWLRSALWLSAVATLIVSFLTVGLLVFSGSLDWDRFLAHQNMWVVAIGPGFLAALAGYISSIDKQATRAISTRAVAEWKRTISTFVVLLWWTFILYLLHFMTAFVAYWTLTGTPVGELLGPLGDMFAFTVVCTIAATGYLVVVTLAVNIAGPIGALIVALIYVIIGVIFAESALWMFVPPAWLMRPVLPIIGTHVNGTSLEGAQIAHSESALVLSTGIALLLCFLWVVRSNARERRMRNVRNTKSSEDETPGLHGLECLASHFPTRKVSIVHALPLAILRRSGLLILIALSIASIAWLRFYLTADEAITVFSLFVLPIGCGMLSIIVVARWRRGMRAIATRASSVKVHAFQLLVAESFLLAIVIAGTLFIALDPVTPIGRNLLTGGLLWIFGMMLLTFSTWIYSVCGVLVTLLITITGTIAGLLIGGNQTLQQSFGLFIPWSWVAIFDGHVLPFTLIAASSMSLTFGAAAVWSLAKRTSTMN